MPDIEGILDKTPREKKRPDFNRLVPKEGIEITHLIDGQRRIFHFTDANDAPQIMKMAVAQIARNDPNLNFINVTHIFRGSNILRSFRVYVLVQGSPCMVFSLYEKVDNPHGYGAGDFNYEKYVFPEHVSTLYPRFAANDIFNMMFALDSVKRLYGYVKVYENIDPKGKLWELLDVASNSCNPRLFDFDGPTVQKYASWSKFLDTDKGKYGIMEINGDIYRSMDIEEYYFTVLKNLRKNTVKTDEDLAKMREKLKVHLGVMDAMKQKIRDKYGKKD